MKRKDCTIFTAVSKVRMMGYQNKGSTIYTSGEGWNFPISWIELEDDGLTKERANDQYRRLVVDIQVLLCDVVHFGI